MNQKKYFKIVDIVETYNISRMTLHRWRRKAANSDDPFPKPVRETISGKFFLASEVDAWFDRNISTI